MLVGAACMHTLNSEPHTLNPEPQAETLAAIFLAVLMGLNPRPQALAFKTSTLNLSVLIPRV